MGKFFRGESQHFALKSEKFSYRRIHVPDVDFLIRIVNIEVAGAQASSPRF
jgi:hypothetical protein